MFLKKTEFKKLIKDTYKTVGLTVGAILAPEDKKMYEFMGSYWKLFVLDEYFPKEAKAAVMELCGELPEIGECFTARNKVPLQYEMDLMTYEDIIDLVKKAGIEYKITHIVEEGIFANTRFLQESKGTLIGINNRFIDAIDVTQIETEKGETMPDGPVTISHESLCVFWHNNACVLQVYRRKPHEQEDEDVSMWEQLKEVDIY